MANDRPEEDRKPTEEIVPPTPTSVALAEMGKIIDAGQRIVQLSEVFLLNHLQVTWFDDILFEHGAKSRRTELLCPFCGDGCLELLTMDPLYRDTKNERRQQDQVGSKYLYRCSDNSCPARFWGNYFWEDAPRERNK